jgi:hypothetical protein
MHGEANLPPKLLVTSLAYTAVCQTTLHMSERCRVNPEHLQRRLGEQPLLRLWLCNHYLLRK